jgi:hypothetical protein
VINSDTRNHVITAGECVLPSRTTGAQRPWNSGFLFTRTPHRLDIPEAETTEFTVSDFQTTPERQEGDGGGDLTEFNVAILVMNTNNQGQHIANVLGGQGLVIDAPKDQSIRTFELRTDSETTAIYTCQGRSYGAGPADPSGIELFTACYTRNVKPGYLGGPWLASYRPSAGLGYLRSITTGILRNDKLKPPSIGDAYGPSFGKPVADLFNRMRGRGANDLWIPIGGKNDQRRTGIQVANLDPVRDANVAINFLDDDAVRKTIYTTIKGGASYTAIDQAPEGSHTVHVTRTEATDTRIAAAGNHISSSGSGSPDGSTSSSNGFSTGSRQVLLPLLMADNFGMNTRFTIQNTEWRDVSVTIAFQAPREGPVLPPPAPIENVVIKARSARTWLQHANPSAPTAKVFSAVINATGDVAATVLEESGDGQLEYQGLPASALRTDLILPLIQANNYGGYTGVQVQNPSSTDDAVVKLVYGANQATADAKADPPCGSGPAWRPNDFAFAVPKLASLSVLQHPGDSSPSTLFDEQFVQDGRPCRYIGSARVVPTLGATPIAAVVNQVAPVGQSAYEGSGHDMGTDRVDLPLIQGNNPTSQTGTSLTGIQIFNSGPREAKVTIEYGANVAENLGRTPCPKPADRPEETIPPDGALNLLYGTHDEAEPWSKTCAYVGSAVVKGELGDELLVTVNQVMNNGVKDGVSTYNGLNFETLPPRFVNEGP